MNAHMDAFCYAKPLNGWAGVPLKLIDMYKCTYHSMVTEACFATSQSRDYRQEYEGNGNAVTSNVIFHLGMSKNRASLRGCAGLTRPSLKTVAKETDVSQNAAKKSPAEAVPRIIFTVVVKCLVGKSTHRLLEAEYPHSLRGPAHGPRSHDRCSIIM